MAELLYSATLIYAQNFQQIPLLIVVSIWYLAMTTVLSIGLLLEHLGRPDQARKVNAAVAFDLSTREPHGKIRTAEVGDRLAALAGG